MWLYNTEVQIEEQLNLGSRNGKKNNYMDLSSDKQDIFYTRIPGYDYEKDIEVLLIATENNAVKNNNVKAKINNT